MRKPKPSVKPAATEANLSSPTVLAMVLDVQSMVLRIRDILLMFEFAQKDAKKRDGNIQNESTFAGSDFHWGRSSLV